METEFEIDETNKQIVEAIIVLLKGYDYSKGCKRRMADYKYLACQCIRQYRSPSDHYHVSVAAQKLWDELTEVPIGKYFYRDAVPCDKLKKPIALKKYIGASRVGGDLELKPGGTFIFNDLFQCDHVVPVSLIFNQLSDPKRPIKDLAYDYISSVLNEMHLCKITKQEDFDLGRTRNRFPSFMDTITKGAYCKIDLVEDQYLIEHGYKGMRRARLSISLLSRRVATSSCRGMTATPAQAASCR